MLSLSVAQADAEQGLNGLAFSPDGTKLYVNYTDTTGSIRVSEFTMAGDVADTATRRDLLTIPHPTYTNHQGGEVIFGPDGDLYIGTGDGGGAGDPNNNAQNTNSLLGKILRIDPAPSGSLPYTIPADNPFAGQAGKRGEIWMYGLRNPWRFSFDRTTGQMWIGDVGQSAYEEVDLAAAGQGGQNWGWPLREGLHAYNNGVAPAGALNPLIEEPHTSGWCALVGGYVYRGAAIANFNGAYVFGDDCRTALVGAVESGGAVIDLRDLGLAVSQLTSFGEDPNGEIYVATLTGSVYELTDASTLPTSTTTSTSTSTSTSTTTVPGATTTTTTTVPVGGCPCTLFGATAPAVADSGDANANVELGVRFTSDSSGSVTGVRFYKSVANTGTHTGSLWTSAGGLLATGTFTGESASGWQTLTFTTPVGITAGTTYVASYHTTAGHYASTHNGFTVAYNNPPLHAPASGTAGNGVYRYGAAAFPNQSYVASNYWVDPQVVTTAPPPTTTTTTSTSTSTTTTTSTSTSTTTTTVPGATTTTTTTVPVGGCPCTLFGATAPAVADSGDANANVELGVRFTSDSSGSVTGVRFYKSVANTGTHTGSLWTSAGGLLATGTFTGESASGWQTLTFTTPVGITAGTTYVASYHTTAGHYASTHNGFTVAYNNPPLHAPASGTAGNGVYRYGAAAFPNQSYVASNYWVDPQITIP